MTGSASQVGVVAGVDVDMQVLGILVATQVGQDASGPDVRLDLPGDPLQYGEECANIGLILGNHGRQGRQMPLGYHDNVRWPERSGVMIGKNGIVGVNDI